MEVKLAMDTNIPVCINSFTHCCGQVPYKGGLKGRVYLGLRLIRMQFLMEKEHLQWKKGGDSVHIVRSHKRVKAVRNTVSSSFSVPAHGCHCSHSASIFTTQILRRHSHRHTQGRASTTILNPVRLTMKIKHLSGSESWKRVFPARSAVGLEQ